MILIVQAIAEHPTPEVHRHRCSIRALSILRDRECITQVQYAQAKEALGREFAYRTLTQKKV